MKKEDIKKLAENGNSISGIYHYCDRWCERCLFTARCMNFAMTRHYSDDPEASDISNEKFWQSLSDIFKVTRESVEETVQEMGVDLDRIDFEESAREYGINDKITENHEFFRLIRTPLWQCPCTWSGCAAKRKRNFRKRVILDGRDLMNAKGKRRRSLAIHLFGST